MAKHLGPTIQILKWAEYNYRKDVKNPSWFRFEHRMIESVQFYHFSDAEWKAWTYILSQASQRSSGTFTVNLEHAERACRVKPAAIWSALKKLQSEQIALVLDTDAVRARNVNVTDAGPTQQDTTLQDNTEQNTTGQNTIAHPAAERACFDLDSLYQKYPRKLGKQKGIERARAAVKTRADFESLSKAIDRYATHVRNEGTEAKYVKHFSSFMSCWRDWLEPDAGKLAVSTPAGYQETHAELERRAIKQAELETIPHADPEAIRKLITQAVGGKSA